MNDIAVPTSKSSQVAAALEAKLQKSAGKPTKLIEKGIKRFELESNNRDWIIENYTSSSEPMKIEDPKMNQNVHVRDSSHITVHICKKVNNVTLENCEHVILILDKVISCVEILRTRESEVQVLGTAPAISIDTCQGLNIYVSLDSKNVQITSSQIADVNLHYPESKEHPDEWIEAPIPAQFIHSLAPNSNQLVSKVSDLYH